MAKSLFAVQTVIAGFPPVSKNVLAQPSVSPVATALQVAQDAAVAAAGTGAVVNLATELAQRPADYAMAAAVSPVTDGTPKAMYLVSFRPGSGAGGSSPMPVLVLAQPQTSSGVTTPASDGAVSVAGTEVSATPNGNTLIGTVDIDAT